MLAGKLENLSDIKYPCYCTPKLDGIRCLIKDGKAVSRTLKPIRNKFVQLSLMDRLEGLDGELVLNGPANFNETTSAIMSEEGNPDFVYAVFDMVLEENYLRRVDILSNVHFPNWIKIIKPTKISTEKEFLEFEEKCLKEGYEGVILRQDAPYKFGRSTVKEGWMLKWKRFTDSEAVILSLEEKMTNLNPQETDKLGYSKRTSKKENLEPAGTLGNLVVEDNGIVFRIGTGFDDAMRQEIWDYGDHYIGKVVKYKYQEVGVKEAPRFPVFLGFRED
jgi:DNA ligase-1